MVQMYSRRGFTYYLVQAIYLNAYQYPLEVKWLKTAKVFKINLWKIVNKEKKTIEILDYNRLKKDKCV